MKKKYILNTTFLLINLLILFGISLLIMYHARFISNIFSNHFYKQSMWIVLGIVLALICYLLPRKIWDKFSFPLYFMGVFSLILVLFLGVSINGAKAWIKLGAFNFQPSEFMKFAYAIYLARVCKNRIFYTIKDEFKFLLKVLIIFLVPSILVFLEPDTGAIIFYFLITITLLWQTKISRRWFIVFLVIIMMFGASFFYLFFLKRDFLIKIIGTGFFYRVERLFAFGSGMQIENALTALGSSPLWQFNLTKALIYIPEAPTDFIFALSSNVFGLSGPLLILIVYLGIDYSLLNLLHLKTQEEDKLFLLAFLAIFFFSQLENIGMNLGLLPIIGIPLPFLSYGGSCMIVMLAFLGIILKKDKSSTNNSKTFKIDYL